MPEGTSQQDMVDAMIEWNRTVKLKADKAKAKTKAKVQRRRSASPSKTSKNNKLNDTTEDIKYHACILCRNDRNLPGKAMSCKACETARIHKPSGLMISHANNWEKDFGNCPEHLKRIKEERKVAIENNKNKNT